MLDEVRGVGRKNGPCLKKYSFLSLSLTKYSFPDQILPRRPMTGRVFTTSSARTSEENVTRM